eukprot:jgi/Mesvir1/5265/Mv15379-RA.1
MPLPPAGANTEKFSSDGENESLMFGASAMQGWRVGMEDAHATLLDLDDKKTSFFAVYDGHGGKEVALFCSRHLHNGLLSSPAYHDGNLAEALKESFLRMDEMMTTAESCKELEELAGQTRTEDDDDEDDDSFVQENTYRGPLFTGCTAVVAVVTADGKLHVANAGDSRCVLSNNGMCEELSKDHKPENQDEKARICNAGGFVANRRVGGMLGLSRAIGDMAFKQNPQLSPRDQMVTAFPEIRTVQLEEGHEFMVLACDGIWDVMGSQEVVDFVRERLRKRKCISKVCEDLLDGCLAPDTWGGLGCDNMSLVVVVFKNHLSPNFHLDVPPSPRDMPQIADGADGSSVDKDKDKESQGKEAEGGGKAAAAAAASEPAAKVD